MGTTHEAFGFNGKNKQAQAHAAQHAAEMVSRITQKTREAIRQLIVRSISDGIAPRDAARIIADIIGLDPKSAGAVYNYRVGLERDGSLPPSRIDVLTERYADKKLDERAEMIARTEVMTALNAGSEESGLQAREDGLLDNPVKTVIVTDDEKLCEICAPLNDEEAPLGQDFSEPGPPFHPRCRCTFAITEGSGTTKES